MLPPRFPLRPEGQSPQRGKNGGSRAGASKLTEADIPHIFAMRASGMPVREIAQHFPVQSHAIDMILARRTWRHVIIVHDELVVFGGWDK